MPEAVTFNGVDLSTVTGLTIIGTDPQTPAPRSLNISELARSDQSKVSAGFYFSRKIHVLATISRASKSDLQSSMRELEGILQGIEKLLVLDVAGTSTEFIATKANISESNRAGGFVELDIEYICSNPTGYAVSATTLYSYSHLVGSEYDFAVAWLGNVKQQPVITIALNSFLGTALKEIAISNETSGQTCTILRSWTAAEVLVINCKTKEVTVDGEPVEFSGAIPEFENNEAINYADTFSNRDISVSIAYQERNI